MTVYSNELDSWYNSCPGPVRSVLHSPYSTISDALHWVTGDPDRVAGAGSTYIAAGNDILRYGQSVTTITSSTNLWTGPAKDAFSAKMALFEKNLATLGEAVGATDEILKAAADTCVQAANMIIDIVKVVIEFLISSLAVALATAIFTFGASVGAWIAANLANGARALAEVMSGLAKVAAVLEKIAQVLEKLAAIFTKVANTLREIQALLKTIKELKAGATLGERLVLIGANAAVSLPINQAANLAINGASAATGTDLPNMPGGVSETYHSVKDAVGAVESGNAAIHAGEDNAPPGR
jgi:uncharacterized protein YukE